MKKRLTKIQATIMAICSPVLFVILSTFNMLIYRGGHHTEYEGVPYHFEGHISNYDPTDLRYIFSLNYVSDLGNLWTFDGRFNTVSTILFCITLTAFGVMMIPYFRWLPSLFENDAKSKKVVTIGSKLAIIASIAYAGIGWTPWNAHLIIGILHNICTTVGFVLVIPIGILIAIGIFRSRDYPNTYAWVNVFLAFSVLAYMGSNFVAPPYTTEEGFIFQILAQKAIIYTLACCIFLESIGTYRYLVKKRNVPPFKLILKMGRKK